MLKQMITRSYPPSYRLRYLLVQAVFESFLTGECLLCFCKAERVWLEGAEVFAYRYWADDRELVSVRFLVFDWLG
jgi:hypothetical protein